jgi:hypothetical protein
MYNKLIALLIVAATAKSLLAQSTPVQAPPVSSYPAYANTSQVGASGLSFSNRVGQVFSPEALASQLQNLRSSVDQILPVLMAFNESYSNALTGGSRSTVGGALSGIVSDVLHRNQTSSQASSTGQSVWGATNLLSMLHGLLSTNSNGAAGTAAPGNAQDLIALQSNLQAVDSILQRLNVSQNPNQSVSPYNNNVGAPLNNPNGNLTPTGR